MATLYLCERVGAAGFQKHVAIKVVHAELSNDERFVEMFVDEAMISARIQHPNVVHVEELGEEHGVYYLVMEYVHGCSVAQLLRALAQNRRRMRPELAVHVMMAVADGLHAAHEMRGPDAQALNVVHRDVSPENILISATGHVKLIDFGVAKSRDRVAQTTAGGTIKGKFSYMAPEHARNLDVDRRSDVYQAGIVLWEMLTMQRCFKGKMSLEFLERVRNPNVRPPSEIAPGISAELEAAVMRALAVQPADRFGSAQAFRRALGAAMPQALALDSSHLAELLATMLGTELQEDRERLPVDLPHASSFDASEVLRTCTVDNVDLVHPSDIQAPGHSSPPPAEPSQVDPITSASRPNPRQQSFRSAVGLSDFDDDENTEVSDFDAASVAPPSAEVTSEETPAVRAASRHRADGRGFSRRMAVRWIAGAVAAGFGIAIGARLFGRATPEWRLTKPKLPKQRRQQ